MSLGVAQSRVRSIGSAAAKRALRRAGERAARAIFEALETRELLSAAILRPDHIVVVIEEDRASDAIGDVAHMPYFNQLAASGLVYTNSHGVAHPSLPDYLALYSGSTQGITDNGNNHTFTGTNLAKVMNSTQIAAGEYLSFGGFAESLPHDGDTTTRIAGDPNDPSAPPDLYMRNYNPMAQFTDVGSRGGVALTAQVNKTFASFPTTAAGFDALPTVSFVIPNSLHNTHGSNEQAPYATDPAEYNFLRSSADTWLKAKMDGYLQWAKSHNSLLIVTTDEEETDGSPTEELTTIINGDPRLVVPGVNGEYVNHFNLLRTIEDMYGLAPLGSTATAADLTVNALGQLSFPGQVTSQSDSMTTLTSSASSSVWGQSVTFIAAVAPLPGGSGVASGAVTFMDGATTLGSATLDGSGRATLSISTLAVGSHSITAVFGGNGALRSSSSGPMGLSVNRASTSVTVTAPATAGTGQAVTFSARVTAVAPGAGSATGTVQFLIDGTNFGAPVALSGGMATSASISSLGVGNHTITAIYGGDTNFVGANGSAVTQVLALAGTTTTLAVSPSPSVLGQSVQLVATVAASGSATPSGNVTFMDGSSAIGTVALNGAGVATLNIATLAVGTHSLTAVYAGNASLAASTSLAVPHTVTQSNDKFANRLSLTGASVTTTGTNVGATKESGEPKHAGNAGGKSVWWTWTASASGKVTIDTAGSNFDTLLAVYTGTIVSKLTAVSGGNNDNDPAGGVVTSKVTFNVTAGKVYQIAVDGKNGASGAITLHLNMAPPAPAAPAGVAASDGLFSDRVQITWNASVNATAYEVWRSTTNSSGSATKISAADVAGGTSFDDLTAVPSTTYYYWVKAKNASGTSAFSASNSGFRALMGPVNDNFADRTVLTGTSLTVTTNNMRATKEAGEPNHAGNVGGKSIWFTWTAPSSGTVTIDTAGSNFDTLLAVYTGNSVSALTAVSGGSNDDSLAGGTTTSKVSFNVTAGTVYQIAIDGYDGVWGNITLHLNLV